MVRWMLQAGPSSLAGVAASTSMGHQDPLEHLEVEVEVGGGGLQHLLETIRNIYDFLKSLELIHHVQSLLLVQICLEGTFFPVSKGSWWPVTKALLS